MSSWLLFIDKHMLDHIGKFMETEAKRVLQVCNWALYLDESYAFIANLYACGF